MIITDNYHDRYRLSEKTLDWLPREDDPHYGKDEVRIATPYEKIKRDTDAQGNITYRATNILYKGHCYEHALCFIGQIEELDKRITKAKSAALKSNLKTCKIYKGRK